MGFITFELPPSALQTGCDHSITSSNPRRGGNRGKCRLTITGSSAWSILIELRRIFLLWTPPSHFEVRSLSRGHCDVHGGGRVNYVDRMRRVFSYVAALLHQLDVVQREKLGMGAPLIGPSCSNYTSVDFPPIIGLIFEVKRSQTKVKQARWARNESTLQTLQSVPSPPGIQQGKTTHRGRSTHGASTEQARSTHGGNTSSRDQ